MAVQKRGAKDGGTLWIASLLLAKTGRFSWIASLALAKTEGAQCNRRTPCVRKDVASSLSRSRRGAQQRGSPETWSQGRWYSLDCFAAARKDGPVLLDCFASARKDGPVLLDCFASARKDGVACTFHHFPPVTARRAATWQSSFFHKILSYKSFHSLFMDSIRRNFFALEPALICFSRVIAASIVSRSS